jgi:long-subunit acyl-CoA synthetase (AMP-forming)
MTTTAGSTDKLLLDAAYEWERNHPDRVYMTQPLGNGQVKDYTWRETMDEARRMAAYLRSLNLPPNSNIALISKNCAHFVMTDLAVWMAGHATIALYPTLNAETVSYILDHSDSRLVFIGKLDDWEEMAPGVPADMPKIALPLAPETEFDQWEEIIARHEPITDNPSRSPDEIALMCYTSGSTGRPKGVMHSFGSASIPAQFFGTKLDISADDRVLSYLPLAHVMERATVECASFYTGTHIFFADSLDTFVQDLHRARPTIFISVPRLWLKFQSGVFQKFPDQKLKRLLKIPIVSGIVKKKVKEGLGLAHVRIAGSGSAPLPAELIEWYDRLGINIIEGYGMTEDFAYSHMSTPQLRRPGYVGVAWDNVDTRISEDGEIQIKSPGNMVGYYKAPDLTAECYTDDGYFRTGDRGEYTPDGLLRITGRVKELFKTSKGKYVAPVPIENLLNSDANVELSCVAGLGRPACYAVVQLAEDLRPKISDPAFRQEMEPKLASLLDRINSQVEGYEQMQFLAVVTDEWGTANNFLTPTLKIKRDVIESTYAPHLDAWYESRQKVIWQE